MVEAILVESNLGVLLYINSVPEQILKKRSAEDKKSMKKLLSYYYYLCDKYQNLKVLVSP